VRADARGTKIDPMATSRHDTWDAVDHYINDLFHQRDDVLDEVLASSERAGLPSIAVSAAQGSWLSILTSAIGAQRVLEIGTLGGYSSIWIARGLGERGRLMTLEANAKHAEVAQANFERAGFDDRIELRLGLASETLRAMRADGTKAFDLVFIDADKPGYPDYLAQSLALSHPGTVIIADNVVRDGEVANPHATDEMVRGIQAFNQALAAEPRVTATVLQTVGIKGYDGFAIARVR
jgi:predicted O-methyltransferase YrrM